LQWYLRSVSGREMLSPADSFVAENVQIDVLMYDWGNVTDGRETRSGDIPRVYLFYKRRRIN